MIENPNEPVRRFAPAPVSEPVNELRPTDIKIKLLIIALVAISLLVIAYLLFEPVFQDSIQNKVQDKIVQYRTEGYTLAIVTMMQQSIECQPIPLQYNEQVIEFIAVNCLIFNE